MAGNVEDFKRFRGFVDWFLVGVSSGVLALAFVSYGELKEWRRTEESRVIKVENQTEKIVDALTSVKITMNGFGSELKSNQTIMKTQSDYLKKISDNVVGSKDLRSLEMRIRDLENQLKTSKTSHNFKNIAWRN